MCCSFKRAQAPKLVAKLLSLPPGVHVLSRGQATRFTAAGLGCVCPSIMSVSRELIKATGVATSGRSRAVQYMCKAGICRVHPPQQQGGRAPKSGVVPQRTAWRSAPLAASRWPKCATSQAHSATVLKDEKRAWAYYCFDSVPSVRKQKQCQRMSCMNVCSQGPAGSKREPHHMACCLLRGSVPNTRS